jgi:ring-1,2-phenylacetyl-CoA epoxidase subunit PaaE
MKEALYTQPKSHIKLFYSNRNTAQTIFLEELNALQKEFPERLLIEYLHSESKFLNKARLNRFLLEELIAKNLKYEKANALLYTCGPYDYMQLCEIVARYIGFDKTNIKKEIYTVPEDEGDDDAETVQSFSIADRSAKEVEIHKDGKVFNIKVAYPQSILEAALQENIELPYSCRAGQCSSCATKCISGKVLMSYNAVLTDRDEENGYILTCKGHPISDKVVLSYE